MASQVFVADRMGRTNAVALCLTPQERRIVLPV